MPKITLTWLTLVLCARKLLRLEMHWPTTIPGNTQTKLSHPGQCDEICHHLFEKNDENERIHRILEHLYLLAMGEKRLLVIDRVPLLGVQHSSDRERKAAGPHHHIPPFRSERSARGHDTERGGWAVLLLAVWKDRG